MTICIAAICERGRALVLAADREIGVGYTSTEFVDGKWHPLYRDWYMGISGIVSNATDVIARAWTLEPRKPDAPPELLSSLSIQSHIQKAYQTARLLKAEAKHLSNRGWTLEEFKKDGAKQLPSTTFANIDAQIAHFDFDADLIVCGFGHGDEGPSILTVRNPGVAVDHSKIGFWSVGSGATAAQVSLFAREYSWAFSAEKAAYCVLEAKLAAQHAAGVGDTTDIYLLARGSQAIAIQPDSMKVMKRIWAELKPREYSPEHWAEMQNLNEFSILRSLAR
jgi:20S proteasome alpha/beta subunit